jgi:hypothetical protein
MLWFLKYFRRIFRQKMVFLTQNKAKLCKVLIIALVFEKNANFFAENCQKSQITVIITSTPDWANGWLFALGSIWKMAEIAISGCFFNSIDYVLILTIKMVRIHFGRFFHKLIWLPWTQEPILRSCVTTSAL